MAGGMAGSAILKVAADVRAVTAQGRRVCDLTMGDFDPRQFPIPVALRDGIQAALRDGQTNYPPGAGMLALREAIQAFNREWLGLDYPLESVLVTSGARPGIYGAFRTLVDPGDRIIGNDRSCYRFHRYKQPEQDRQHSDHAGRGHSRAG